MPSRRGSATPTTALLLGSMHSPLTLCRGLSLVGETQCCERQASAAQGTVRFWTHVGLGEASRLAPEGSLEVGGAADLPSQWVPHAAPVCLQVGALTPRGLHVAYQGCWTCITGERWLSGPLL